MTAEQTLIELKTVTARVRNRPILPETSWKIETGSHWAVIGPNGSGKSTLVGILSGNVPVIKGHTVRHCPPAGIGSISFEMHARLMAREEVLDDARHFGNRLAETTTAQDIIRSGSQAEISAETAENRIAQVAAQMDIRHLLSRGIRDLSSGEARKVLLARAMVGNPRLLILDEPYEGLDAASGGTLSQTIIKLMQSGVGIVLVTHQLDKISKHFTHVLCVKSGRVIDQGPRDRILVPDKIARLYGNSRPRQQLAGAIRPAQAPPLRQRTGLFARHHRSLRRKSGS